jgi:hypothetical protein
VTWSNGRISALALSSGSGVQPAEMRLGLTPVTGMPPVPDVAGRRRRPQLVHVKIRPVEPKDRAEWLRLLVGLHPELREADHVPSIDANARHTTTSWSCRAGLPASTRAASEGERHGGFTEWFFDWFRDSWD